MREKLAVDLVRNCLDVTDLLSVIHHTSGRMEALNSHCSCSYLMEYANLRLHTPQLGRSFSWKSSVWLVQVFPLVLMLDTQFSLLEEALAHGQSPPGCVLGRCIPGASLRLGNPQRPVMGMVSANQPRFCSVLLQSFSCSCWTSSSFWLGMQSLKCSFLLWGA